ncbi:MAG: hypothetical protein JXA21_08995 [Anaerolineae bacterium]|nr:hypothetical protein [Anaerolineae bacterium]
MKSRLLGALNAILIMLLVTAGLVWAVTAMTNDDPLWFVRSFTAQADWIVIYWDGETTMLFPGDPGYDAVMSAFADMVGHWSGYEGGTGLSDENLERYRNEWRLLEVHYNDPVYVHTRHLYPKARVFFVPLSGTHANWRRIFAGLQDTPRAGVLNATEARFARLLTTVERVVQPSH